MNSEYIDTKIENILDEYETTLLGDYRKKDVLSILTTLVTENEKMRSQIEPIERKLKSTETALKRVTSEKDAAQRAQYKMSSELDKSRILQDEDYTIVGDHIWLITPGKRWRCDNIVTYTIDHQCRIESINGIKLNNHRNELYEVGLLSILETSVNDALS